MSSIPWEHNNLFDTPCLSIEDINNIIRLAQYFFNNNKTKIKTYSFLNHKNIMLFFAENSTRTRISFEIAAQRLGATTHLMQQAGSSMQKGETLKDTMLTLMAMRPDAFVIRSQYSGVMEYLSQFSTVPILNAGDGWHAHPTQALLDVFTLYRAWGNRYSGRIVTIIGDVKHSRVARSNIHLLQKLGVRVRICSPATLSFIPKTFDGIEIYTDVKDAVKRADAIITLRLQLERQENGLIPKEYYSVYGVTKELLKYANPDVLVLHPGPVNPNVDISAELITDAQHSRIVEQVEAGAAVRMALLYLFCSEERIMLE